jgi:hypothetical protein
MARKLKTYQASLGFFDTAIAAPSMKAALEAWGSKSNLFHQGVAQQTDDPDIVAATMAKPGVILRRPVGSDEPFEEESDLPADLPRGKTKKRRRPPRASQSTTDVSVPHNAAETYEREERKRERQRRNEAIARVKKRERRERAVAKAESALDAAKREHEMRARKIDVERERLEKRWRSERDRWEKQRKKLSDALHKAHR